jgi:hypothetical protein
LVAALARAQVSHSAISTVAIPNGLDDMLLMMTPMERTTASMAATDLHGKFNQHSTSTARGARPSGRLVGASTKWIRALGTMNRLFVVPALAGPVRDRLEAGLQTKDSSWDRRRNVWRAAFECLNTALRIVIGNKNRLE